MNSERGKLHVKMAAVEPLQKYPTSGRALRTRVGQTRMVATIRNEWPTLRALRASFHEALDNPEALSISKCWRLMVVWAGGMVHKHPSVREVVDYGLERISQDRSVSVPVRELVRLFKVFEELNAFFHQPMHYPNVDAVQEFLGTATDGGACGLIAECLYETLPSLLPDDIMRTIESGELEHPTPLAYREP